MELAERDPAMKEAGDAELSAVVNALRRIVRAVRVSSHTAEETLGISGARLFVLQQLAEHPAASLSELAGRTLTDQSSVSVVVSRLVESKLVARKTSAQDKRRAELSLTAAGRALLRKAPEAAQARLVTALRKVSSRDLRVTAKVLESLARDMGVASEPPSMFFESDPTVSRSKGKRRNVK
jgi:DNA-binding MarR family transcriptional regulator